MKRLTPGKIAIAGIVVLVLALAVWGWQKFSATAAVSPSLDELTLNTKALSLAHKWGLIGKAQSQKAVRMTLSEWAKTNKGQLGKDAGKYGLTPTLPVYVLAVRGQVKPTGPMEFPPNQPEPEYVAMIIVLNALTGEPISGGYYRAVDPLPFDVP
ncbi:hypothetical protein FBQ82_14930 [Anaerolineae bacterium CFX7]|nr:hypothetical protein [Anaerolineae bacterium CFX7]